MIGFVPQEKKRLAIKNEQGTTVGYLASENGRQVFQTATGKTVATIKQFKATPQMRMGACSGSVLPYFYGSIFYCTRGGPIVR